MVGVTGSIPVAPTINFKDLAGFCRPSHERWPHRHATRRSPGGRLAIDGAASGGATPQLTKIIFGQRLANENAISRNAFRDDRCGVAFVPPTAFGRIAFAACSGVSRPDKSDRIAMLLSVPE
jgi:hypothetical protein